jgi:hypothetical protein
MTLQIQRLMIDQTTKKLSFLSSKRASNKPFFARRAQRHIKFWFMIDVRFAFCQARIAYAS